MTKFLNVILPWLTRRLMAGVAAVGIVIGAPPEANQQVTAFITAALVFGAECLQKWLILRWQEMRRPKVPPMLLALLWLAPLSLLLTGCRHSLNKSIADTARTTRAHAAALS